MSTACINPLYNRITVNQWLEKADYVQVVRCKDCKHWDEESTFCCYTEGCYGLETQPNWFCADGEREANADK